MLPPGPGASPRRLPGPDEVYPPPVWLPSNDRPYLASGFDGVLRSIDDATLTASEPAPLSTVVGVWGTGRDVFAVDSVARRSPLRTSPHSSGLTTTAQRFTSNRHARRRAGSWRSRGTDIMSSPCLAATPCKYPAALADRTSRESRNAKRRSRVRWLPAAPRVLSRVSSAVITIRSSPSRGAADCTRRLTALDRRGS